MKIITCNFLLILMFNGYVSSLIQNNGRIRTISTGKFQCRQLSHLFQSTEPSEPINDENLALLSGEKRKSKGSEPEFSIPGDSTVETPGQRITVFLHFAALVANLSISFNHFLQLGNVNLPLMIATIMASIFLGDFATGVFHWSVDNYGRLETPVFGSVCAAFQGHHVTPWTITFRSFSNNVYKIAYGSVAALTLLAISPADGYLRTFLALFINWWLLSQEFHKYSHMRQVPAMISALQDAGIILSRKEHGLHHSSPFESHYCILTGVCNPLLDKSHFFRHLERFFFHMTGTVFVQPYRIV